MESRVGSATKRVLPSVEQVCPGWQDTLPSSHAAPNLLQVKYYQYPALALILQAPGCLLPKVTVPPGESWSQVQASRTRTTPGLVVWRPCPETSPAGSNLIHTHAPQDVKGAADVEDLRKKLRGSEAALQAQQASMQAVQEVQTCSTLNPYPKPCACNPSAAATLPASRSPLPQRSCICRESGVHSRPGVHGCKTSATARSLYTMLRTWWKACRYDMHIT